ncbi:hypothetical protein ACQEVC_24540 [Plantactinospora sp. CA-294935]|uniref:hypothetical protein n=1 Tax=Plantactinospora sp. CA-294935 TaxID=3240012 RepID=UPI003D943DA1
MTARSPRYTESTQGRLRRLNLAVSLPPLMIAAAFVLLIDAHAWWHLVVLAPGVAAGLVAFERWTANDLARVALPGLIVAGVVWPLGCC